MERNKGLGEDQPCRETRKIRTLPSQEGSSLNGKAEKIVVNTGEDFVWRLLDIANRTALATAELAGVDLDLEWDEEGKFKVSVLDSISVADDVDAGTFTHQYQVHTAY